MPRAKPQRKTYTDEQLVAFIAAALTMNAGLNATAEQVAKPLGIPTSTVVLALALARGRPVPVPGPTLNGSPSALSESDRLEAYFRAHYVLAASRRLDEKLSKGIPKRVAMEQERNFFQQHIGAVANRRKSANAVDRAAARYGATLGWHATIDARTSPECKAAHGRNFDVGVRPAIGYPGSVHPFCRCKPGKPFATRNTVYSLKVKVS